MLFLPYPVSSIYPIIQQCSGLTDRSNCRFEKAQCRLCPDRSRGDGPFKSFISHTNTEVSAPPLLLPHSSPSPAFSSLPKSSPDETRSSPTPLWSSQIAIPPHQAFVIVPFLSTNSPFKKVRIELSGPPPSGACFPYAMRAVHEQTRG